MPGWQPLVGFCDPTSLDAAKRCGLEAFITLIKNGITDLVLLSTLVGVAAFMWAGFRLLTSGGSESARTDAKEMFRKIVLGYLLVVGAWVIVYTITSTLLYSNFSVIKP